MQHFKALFLGGERKLQLRKLSASVGSVSKHGDGKKLKLVKPRLNLMCVNCGILVPGLHESWFCDTPPPCFFVSFL